MSMKKIVLLGDSIRLGYAPYVEEALGAGYEVVSPPDNGRFAAYTLRACHELREQIEGADAVHWNNGLWDTCDMFGDGCFTPLSVYTDTLCRIARILQEGVGRVIFATTTPVDPTMPYHRNADTEVYNAAAVAALAPLGVEINDLYTPIAADIGRYISEDKIHLSEAGKHLCAALVAEKVKQALGE